MTRIKTSFGDPLACETSDRDEYKQKTKLCFYILWQVKNVIQIETLKNVKYVPAKELVPAIIKVTVYYFREYSRSYVDS